MLRLKTNVNEQIASLHRAIITMMSSQLQIREKNAFALVAEQTPPSDVCFEE